MVAMFSKGNGSGECLSPLDSATVMLIRELSAGGFEVFLMRRHRRSDFMAGAYVFPGGRLDDEDCDPELAGYARGITPAEAVGRLKQPGLAENTAMGLHFAAVRETFEESGVLLAYDENGRIVDLSDDETRERFGGYREKIHKKEISLKKLARQEEIYYALDLLVPYSRWITPEIEKKRFDTRFFMTRIPSGQSPAHCNIEMTESLWVAPSDALTRNKTGDILLMPPTLKTLEEFEKFDLADRLFSEVPSELPAILPQAYSADGCFGVKLPHDPEYTIAEYKQPPRPAETSRLILEGRRWRTVKPL